MGQESSSEALDVITSFDFVSFDDDSEKPLDTPRFWDEPNPSHECIARNPRPTWVTRSGIPIRDLRPTRTHYTVQKNGFALVDHLMQTKPVLGDDTSIQSYLHETTKKVRETLGAHEVFCFDFRFRKNQPLAVARQEQTPGTMGRRIADTVNPRPHVDHTQPEGLARIRRYLSEDEVSKYMGASKPFRFMIVNAWRPLRHPVEDNPLALCEFDSIDLRDLARSQYSAEETYLAESYLLRYNAGQRWNFFSRQEPSELLLFKNFDSAVNATPRFIPHAAFTNPLAHKNVPPRESIECRFVVILKDDVE